MVRIVFTSILCLAVLGPLSSQGITPLTWDAAVVLYKSHSPEWGALEARAQQAQASWDIALRDLAPKWSLSASPLASWTTTDLSMANVPWSTPSSEISGSLQQVLPGGGMVSVSVAETITSQWSWGELPQVVSKPSFSLALNQPLWSPLESAGGFWNRNLLGAELNRLKASLQRSQGETALLLGLASLWVAIQEGRQEREVFEKGLKYLQTKLNIQKELKTAGQGSWADLWTVENDLASLVDEKFLHEKSLLEQEETLKALLGFTTSGLDNPLEILVDLPSTLEPIHDQGDLILEVFKTQAQILENSLAQAQETRAAQLSLKGVLTPQNSWNGWFDPQMAWTAKISLGFTWAGSISDQVVFIDQQDKAKMAENLFNGQSLLDQRNRAEKLWGEELRALSTSLQVAQRVVERTTIQESEANSMVKAGLATPIDLLYSQWTLAQAKLKSTKIQNKILLGKYKARNKAY